MIKFKNTEVVGFEHAIRGMRNPLNSWSKSDSLFMDLDGDCYDICGNHAPFYGDDNGTLYMEKIGKNDMDLMKRLRNSGTDHRKFMRTIVVYTDIIAPLYWWKEFDTYKVGTVSNSCSTMHKIHEKEFTLEDFSYEHLSESSINILNHVILFMNIYREEYLKDKNKHNWWQMIQLLPSSYNQKRTVMMNYEVLSNIYKSRKNHKLDEWSIGFVDWIKTLPYAKELIIGEE